MKKIITLSVVCASFMFANTTVSLDEVEVISTATKSEKKIDGIAASVEVITEAKIQKMGAESLKDVLNKTSGLTVQYGTFPSASSKSKSSISIRGMSANGTLFLVDGRRLAGEVKNPYDLDRIPASSIERIEIVKGPMSSLYGADATGGVVNIITKKATQKPEINLGIRYGQNADGDDKNKKISLSVRGAKDKLKYSVYANKSATTPYTQKETANVRVQQVGGPNTGTKQLPSAVTGGTPSAPLAALSDTYTHDVTYREDSDVTTVGARFDYEISDSSILGFDFNAFDEERDGSYIGYFHPSNYATPAGGKVPVFNIPVNSKDENKRIDLGLDYETTLNDDLLLKLRAYRSSYKKRNTTTAIYWQEMGYASEGASASNGMNANVDIMSYEAMLNYFVNDEHILTAGAEYRDEEREATVFDSTPNMDTREVDYKSLYLQDEWQISDTLNAIIGARYDQVSNADNKATFKLGVVNKFSEAANLRAIFAQGYRTPDIREMYINKQTPNGLQQGADVVGYDLKPEFTNTYELGLNGRSGNFSYDGAIFLNKIEDRISQVFDTVGNYYTFENISKAETKGLELSLNYQILDNLSTGFNFMELRTEDKSTRKDLEFNPKRTASLSFDYQATEAFNVSAIAKYTGKQHYTDSSTATEKTTNAFTLVDLNLNYDINSDYSIYGGINNLFDKEIDDILGSSSGRYFFTGINVKF